jgi:hypothetical protein
MSVTRAGTSSAAARANDTARSAVMGKRVSLGTRRALLTTEWRRGRRPAPRTPCRACIVGTMRSASTSSGLDDAAPWPKRRRTRPTTITWTPGSKRAIAGGGSNHTTGIVSAGSPGRRTSSFTVTRRPPPEPRDRSSAGRLSRPRSTTTFTTPPPAPAATSRRRRLPASSRRVRRSGR